MKAISSAGLIGKVGLHFMELPLELHMKTPGQKKMQQKRGRLFFYVYEVGTAATDNCIYECGPQSVHGHPHFNGK
eukprot:CAMPEP_0174313414 /NCGR_PEP_ID=MMETSP0810-20121108/4956_1 /TAXON_ID=73025 ORGANISM="Eutreptiella gymnastica-like, Strain CCMP1594" /NCGR_SAMPLE_ID=MMETSP0810 /ASSEMBLY_ACC=CAM_ASM_000659 /LENGTH=74 /DNA_ID=CAMNT_0015422163 /DNA_START=101 /DNA_END=325 /DNA_ORIENTATION=-